MNRVEADRDPRDGRRDHPQQAGLGRMGMNHLRPQPAHQPHEAPKGNRILARAHLTFHRHAVRRNPALPAQLVQLLAGRRNRVHVEACFGQRTQLARKKRDHGLRHGGQHEDPR